VVKKTPVARLHELRDAGLVERGLEQRQRKPREVIAETHDQEGLRREFLAQSLHEARIVARTQHLPAQIFVQLRAIAVAAPFRCEFGPELKSPGKMVRYRIDEQEQRIPILVIGDHPRGRIIEESIRLHASRAEPPGVIEILDARRFLETSRAQKRSEKRVEAVGLVAAAPQQPGQPALHPARRDARDEVRETSI